MAEIKITISTPDGVVLDQQLVVSDDATPELLSNRVVGILENRSDLAWVGALE